MPVVLKLFIIGKVIWTNMWSESLSYYFRKCDRYIIKMKDSNDIYAVMCD